VSGCERSSFVLRVRLPADLGLLPVQGVMQTSFAVRLFGAIRKRSRCSSLCYFPTTYMRSHLEMA
jgi:hypothetical protein